MIDPLSQLLTEAAIGLATMSISWIGVELARLVRIKTKSEKAAHVIRVITDVASGVVHEVEKTTRPTLSPLCFQPSGKLTPDGETAMRQIACDLIGERLSKKIGRDARFVVDDLGGFIAGKVEEAVACGPHCMTKTFEEIKSR